MTAVPLTDASSTTPSRAGATEARPTGEQRPSNGLGGAREAVDRSASVLRGRRPPVPSPSPSPRTSIFAVAALVLSTGAGFALNYDGSGTGSVPLVLLLWGVAYAVGGGLLIDSILRLRQRPPMPPWLLLFIVLAATSTFWSEAPSVTLRRSFALAGTTIVGLAIAYRLRPIDVLEAVRAAALLIVVASLALYFLGDARTVDVVHGTLRGVAANKNALGRIAAVGLVASACLVYLDRARLQRCLVTAAPMVLALALTDSAGGVALFVIAGAVIGALAMWRGRTSRLVLVAIVVAGLGAVILAFPNGIAYEDAIAITGRDPTLTGRTDIWDESVLAARERPLSGYGFGAFWGLGGGGVESGAAARIRARLDVPVANAHNGMLDVTLDLGIPGAVVALLVLVGVAMKGIRDAREGRADAALLRMWVVGLIVVSTATESGFLRENSLLTVLLVVAAAARSATETPRRPRFAPPDRDLVPVRT